MLLLNGCICISIPKHTIVCSLSVTGFWGKADVQYSSIVVSSRVELGGSAGYKAPSGRSWHRWSSRLTEQHSMSAALLKRALGIHGAFGRHKHSLFQSAISLMEQNLKSLQTNTAIKMTGENSFWLLLWSQCNLE